MSTENDAEVVAVDDIVESKDADGKDNTDWKALATKYQGIAKRFKTKAEKSKDTPPASPVPPKEPTKSDDLGYAEKAFLNSEGVKGEKAHELVKKVMKETGKKMEEVIGSKYFRAELKEMEEADATKNAIPDPTKRSGQSSRDTVEYWLAKGQLPPPEEVELRRKIVNARIKQERDQNIFTKNPIAGNYNKNR